MTTRERVVFWGAVWVFSLFFSPLLQEGKKLRENKQTRKPMSWKYIWYNYIPPHCADLWRQTALLWEHRGSPSGRVESALLLLAGNKWFSSCFSLWEALKFGLQVNSIEKKKENKNMNTTILIYNYNPVHEELLTAENSVTGKLSHQTPWCLGARAKQNRPREVGSHSTSRILK